MEAKVRKRGAHRKSRWGCISCKTRRVKCDERKPECVNCRLRNLQCSYPSTQTAVAQAYNATSRELSLIEQAVLSADSQCQTEAVSLSSSSSTALTSKGSAALQALMWMASTGPVSGISNPSPLAFSSTPTSNRLLELELLHRWSTRTWRAICTSPGCDVVLLNGVPRISLRNSYLLNSVFALSALDIAKNEPDPGNNNSTILTRDRYRYKSAALEYANRANLAFREALGTADPNMHPKKLSALLFFASFAAVLNLTFPSPKYHASALETLVTSMALYVGSSYTGNKNLDWLNQASCSLPRVVKQFLPPLPPELMHKLDIDTQLAISRLISLNEQVRVSVRLPEESLGELITDVHDSNSQVNNNDNNNNKKKKNHMLFACEIPAYKLTVEQIKYTFMNDATDTPFKAMSFTILALGGRELTAAVKEREPLALFIMLFWAVLIHRSHKRTNVMWWVGDIGKNVVDEVSEVLVTSPFVRLDGVGETIKWARREVGLDSDSDLSPSSLSFLLLLETRCGRLRSGDGVLLSAQRGRNVVVEE
ncbi:hypothetical protein ACJ72_00242 [Emergomyces africanus]|uniref:Zn(2)-C6 fungal-type domain-containing protein n=1 Tax=Emergomyces africanus TaxID=1955775 RepID=A0A1B7P8R8_9EURO|nr:hypothetical protein ACJ72_00242 [Emergomyces africanus]